jgi:hypothetical protein
MIFIRLGLGILMLMSALEVFRVTRTLKNRELVIISKRIGLSILSFALFRIVGGLIDSYFQFEIAYFTTASVYGFWIAVYAFFFYHRRILQSEEVGDDGRQRISASVDSILAEMKRFSHRLDKTLGK